MVPELVLVICTIIEIFAGGEPINPVQAAIAGLIQNMATNQQNPKRIELKRDEKGLFEKQE